MPEEYSESGAPIYRHQERERKPEDHFPDMDGEAIEQIEAHIEQHIGSCAFVWHELISDVVHIDIHVIAPTPERDFFTLVTTGMSDQPMHVPQGVEALQYAEVMLCLPSSWTVTEDGFKQDENYWPVRLLKWVARLPHTYQTWLGEGHTIPNGDPPQPLASNTQLCAVLLSRPMLCSEDFWQLPVRAGKTVQFYSLLPIYQEELDIKLKYGIERLYEGFDAADVSELLDIQRTNVGQMR